MAKTPEDPLKKPGKVFLKFALSIEGSNLRKTKVKEKIPAPWSMSQEMNIVDNIRQLIFRINSSGKAKSEVKGSPKIFKLSQMSKITFLHYALTDERLTSQRKWSNRNKAGIKLFSFIFHWKR